MKAGILIGAAHGELVHVQLADGYGSASCSLLTHGRVIDRIVNYVRTGWHKSSQSFGHNIVLDPGRQSEQQSAFGSDASLSSSARAAARAPSSFRVKKA